MPRFFAPLVVCTLLVASAAAQEATPFRYASDPFDVANAKEPNATKAPTSTADTAKQTAVESWNTTESVSPVHKKAAFRAEQRQLRLETRKWYGASASRPALLNNPYMNTYSPILISHQPHARHIYGLNGTVIWR